jgi:PBP1b-binding outer membrane lipoprotein LpoB
MTTRAVPRLVAAALMAFILTGCSSSAGSSSSESPAATSTTPASTASPTTNTVCTSLADVKSSAATLKSDLQARNLSAVTADINKLDTAFKTLIAGMSSAAQAGSAELQSAWDNVKNTFQGLSKSDIGQVQSKMQAPVDQLKTTLDSVTSGLNCS